MISLFTRLLLCSTLMLFSCGPSTTQPPPEATQKTERQLVTEDFELHLPADPPQALLVLFGGFPETAADIQREFDILPLAREENVALLLMNFNRRTWLSEEEQTQLTGLLTTVIADHQLPDTRVYLGGFSSGGNVALLLANHLVESQSGLRPAGVFSVDSPVDLLQLYRTSERNVERDFMTSSVQESQQIMSRLTEHFGAPEAGIERYEQYAPYTFTTQNIDNLRALEDVPIRLYTEPDTTWWTINRQNDYEDMNAYYLRELAAELNKQFGRATVELIETQNRGVRANGLRHPHSWSIVDRRELLDWMLGRE